MLNHDSKGLRSPNFENLDSTTKRAPFKLELCLPIPEVNLTVREVLHAGNPVAHLARVIGWRG